MNRPFLTTMDEAIFYGVHGKVIDRMNATYGHPFSRDEINNRIFQMHPTKALGSNGMSTLFF